MKRTEEKNLKWTEEKKRLLSFREVDLKNQEKQNFRRQFYVKIADKKNINVFLIQQLIVDSINGKMKCR